MKGFVDGIQGDLDALGAADEVCCLDKYWNRVLEA